jgi:serine/threonine protein kinase
MSYPTLEQYNEALQHPAQALSDVTLRTGSIATTGLGLPLALCGGFALTYTVSVASKKYAVRCFHKKSDSLERRYIEISKRLKALRSAYFVDFEFQPSGVRVAGAAYPVVKMAWASGTTLGEFIEKNHRDKTQLSTLRESLSQLSSYLESQGMAHGDIQPGNVMVSDGGRTLRLIDYDGMFVETLRSLGSAELGHRNFQHPLRTAKCWDSSLDRFSFICLDIALRALSTEPGLWKKYQADGDSILFKANDFADPAQSGIFSDLLARSDFVEDSKNFAAICKAAFDKIPTLADFRQKKNIPTVAVSISRASTATRAKYISAFPVLDVANYESCLSFVGDKVELIGKVVEVKKDTTRGGKPYIFINFGPWQGEIVKVSIWSEGLASLSKQPDDSWVGKWISAVGLLEPPYVSRKYKYSHLAVSITQGSQLHTITQKEAVFRLASKQLSNEKIASSASNQDVLRKIRSDKSPLHTSQSSTARSSNQAILQTMRGTSAGTKPTWSSPPTKATQPSKSGSNCFIATAVYGPTAIETEAFRNWRDNSLSKSYLGRVFISTYYLLSPFFAELVRRHKLLRLVVKSFLDFLLRRI